MNKLKAWALYSLILSTASAQNITEEEAPFPEVVPLAPRESAQPNYDLEAELKRDQAILKKRHLKELRTSKYLQHRELIAELVDTEGNERLYRAKRGETLIWIAFKLYGDYRLWRYLKQNNYKNFVYGMRIYEGMGLYYHPPKKPYREPTGLPYFIKEGDYLENISIQVYGNPNLWSDIKKQNPRQILDQDLILKDFTLFYKPPHEMKKRMKEVGEWTVEDFNHYTNIQSYKPKMVYVEPHQQHLVGTAEFKELEVLPDMTDVYGQIVQEVKAAEAAQERDEDLEPHNDPPFVFIPEMPEK